MASYYTGNVKKRKCTFRKLTLPIQKTGRKSEKLYGDQESCNLYEFRTVKFEDPVPSPDCTGCTVIVPAKYAILPYFLC